MIKQIKNNLYFLLPYLFIALGIIIILFIYPKDELHIAVNRYHNSLFDYFFKYITHLGHGYFVAAVGIVMLLYRYRASLQILISGAITGIIVFVLKRYVFDNSPRPLEYFKGMYELYLVEGVKVHHWHSFPSGHSAGTFALFFSLALITQTRLLKLNYIMIALLAAFSRVYLSQHFLVDTLAGSAIGIIVAFFTWYFLQGSNKTWLEKSILSKRKSANATK